MSLTLAWTTIVHFARTATSNCAKLQLQNTTDPNHAFPSDYFSSWLFHVYDTIWLYLWNCYINYLEGALWPRGQFNLDLWPQVARSHTWHKSITSQWVFATSLTKSEGNWGHQMTAFLSFRTFSWLLYWWTGQSILRVPVRFTLSGNYLNVAMSVAQPLRRNKLMGVHNQHNSAPGGQICSW